MGSPAHAGIDRYQIGPVVFDGRFPRPRGDRPYDNGSIWAGASVPPPTRG